jgi:hypothetical protein
MSVVHLIAAAVVYWHLITGGWLTNHYQLNDPNIVNLVLAIFEPIAIVSVIACWLWRKSPGSSPSSVLSRSSLAILVRLAAGCFSSQPVRKSFRSSALHTRLRRCVSHAAKSNACCRLKVVISWFPNLPKAFRIFVWKDD